MKLKFILTLFISACTWLGAQAQWTQLGGNVDTFTTGNSSYYLETLGTDASGSVYAAGRILDANGHEYVAKFDGVNWNVLGTGTNALNANNYILSICFDPAGNLYAAGKFTNASGFNSYVAKWDGTTWSELGAGQNMGATFVQSVKTIVSDASGNIYAAGELTDSTAANYVVSKWNGSTWSQVGTYSLLANAAINVLRIDGSNLYAAGEFSDGSFGAGNKYVAMWNGTTWARVGTGSAALTANNSIYAMTIDASHNIYISGAFTNGNGDDYVAKWNGSTWSSAGGVAGIGFAHNSGELYAMASDALGNVYVGGGIEDATGLEYVAKWNGTSWSALGTLNANNFINAIATYGNKVYAAGAFSNAALYPYIAKYSPSTGINDIMDITSAIAPNPSNGMFTITFDKALDANISLTDLTGKTLEVWQSNNETSKACNINQYAAGLYIVRIEAANRQSQTIKVVKQ
jgi:hypothetical protein